MKNRSIIALCIGLAVLLTACSQRGDTDEPASQSSRSVIESSSTQFEQESYNNVDALENAGEETKNSGLEAIKDIVAAEQGSQNPQVIDKIRRQLKEKISEHNEPPEIEITLNNRTVAYVIGKNIWNGIAYDRSGTLQEILSEGSGVEVPYIKLGGTVEIAFKDNPPSSIKLYDDIINEKGDNKFSARVTMDIPVELKDGKLSFEFTAHPSSMLSSYLSDYENGKTYRGFRLCCKWDNGNDCEYGFVMRTDAT